jgi:hypothetical protein
VPEPLSMDFKRASLPRFSLAGNKASVLDHFLPIIFPIYSLVCRNYMIGVSLRTPMLETSTTLIDYYLVTP